MKYRVTGTATISVFIDVEADNEEQAEDIANEAMMQSLCHQCASGDPETWSTSGELDGEPEVISVTPLGVPARKRAPRRKRP